MSDLNSKSHATTGDTDDTVLLYGHLDKQPEFTGWEPGLDPWTPVLRGEPEVRGGSAAPGVLTGAFAARGVSFRYGDEGPLVLDDVTVEVHDFRTKNCHTTVVVTVTVNGVSDTDGTRFGGCNRNH